MGHIRRYVTVLRIFLFSSVWLSLEYRVAFYVNLALGAFWLLWATQVARTYYSYGDSIDGWSYGDLLALMGVYFIVNGVRQVFLSPNLRRVGEYVRSGALDHLLLKPMDSQFVVSLRYVDVNHAADPVLGALLLVVAIVHSAHTISAGGLLAFAIALLSAFCLLYFVNLIMQAICVLVVSSVGLSQMMNSIIDAGRLPTSVYGPVVQAALTLIVPVSFIVTAPASILLGKAPGTMAAAAVACVGVFALCARMAWTAALRRYQGVGS